MNDGESIGEVVASPALAIDIYAALAHLKEEGTAPPDGCTVLGVGYEDAFRRLERTYLVDDFDHRRSAVKFVVGPYGSGKTHFLRQLMEVARGRDCVTAEVPLSKDVDFTRTLMIYTEVAREIRVPGSTATGIRALLRSALDRVRDQAPAGRITAFTRAWIDGISAVDYALPAFGRVARRALDACDSNEDAEFEAACRWLYGEVADRALAARLEVSVVQRPDENLHGRRALFSLFRLMRGLGYRGTVVTFDEAEQGLSVDRKKMQRILSMLQSQINAVASLRDGAALIVYALTPNLANEMEGFAALQQRVADPAPGMGFFNGNTRAVRINLTRPDAEELQAIGFRLCDLLYAQYGDILVGPREEAYEAIRQVAVSVDLNDASSGNRRTMVKATSALLLDLYDNGNLDTAAITRIVEQGIG